VHPHLFRRLVGRFHLEAHPNDFETIRRVLGYSTVAATRYAFADLETEAAFRVYDGAIDGASLARSPAPR
jgi:site-specific recombinase XerC